LLGKSSAGKWRAISTQALMGKLPECFAVAEGEEPGILTCLHTADSQLIRKTSACVKRGKVNAWAALPFLQDGEQMVCQPKMCVPAIVEL